jgi:hypothetical protein
MNRDEPFKTLNTLGNQLVEIGLATDDGDRDETDSKLWEHMNAIREILQNELL